MHGSEIQRPVNLPGVGSLWFMLAEPSCAGLHAMHAVEMGAEAMGANL